MAKQRNTAPQSQPAEKAKKTPKPKKFGFKRQCEANWRSVLKKDFPKLTYKNNVWDMIDNDNEKAVQILSSRLPTAVWGSYAKAMEHKSGPGSGSDKQKNKKKKIKAKHIAKVIMFAEFNLPNESELKKKMIEAGYNNVTKWKAQHAEDPDNKATKSESSSKGRKSSKKSEPTDPLKKFENESPLNQTQEDLDSPMPDVEND